MPFVKAPLRNFFYKVSYKNPSPALPILLADFIKLSSSIADFGIKKDKQKRNKKIIEAVKQYGYSQNEIAEYLGMHYSTISRLLKDG